MSKKDEALKLALEAMNLARAAHGQMLLSDPPQEAWKAWSVSTALTKAMTVVNEALAEQSAQQQEPVTVVKALPMGHNQPDMHYAECQHLPAGTLLYTSPPASKPLTRDELRHMYQNSTAWQFYCDVDERMFGRPAHGITGEQK